MRALEPSFWCVWSEDGGSPTVKHPDYPRAKREATRLARANPGKRFVVLAAAAAFVKDDVREVQFDLDRVAYDVGEEIPF